MKILFAGSPEFAVPALDALSKRFGVCGALTQPDRPVGRKRVITPTPVKAYASAAGIPVYEYGRVRDHAAELAAVGADIMITCAYGQILSREILGIFPLGVWNLHASLLPRHRGASPVQAAILSGDKYTGVTVMRTEEALDTGDMLLVKRVEVGEKSCGELTAELSLAAAEAAVEAVELISAGQTQLLMQNDYKATYCKKITKADVRIDFSASAEEVCRLVRAADPQPLAYCTHGGGILNIIKASPAQGKGEAGRVLSADGRGVEVACGEGSVLVTFLQPAGGRAMRAADFVNGRKIAAGDRLE